jgi:heme exporter protein D
LAVTLLMWLAVSLSALFTVILLVATFAEERAVRQGR